MKLQGTFTHNRRAWRVLLSDHNDNSSKFATKILGCGPNLVMAPFFLSTCPLSWVSWPSAISVFERDTNLVVGSQRFMSTLDSLGYVLLHLCTYIEGRIPGNLVGPCR